MGPLHLVSPSHPAPAPSADTDMEEEDRAWSPADYMRSVHMYTGYRVLQPKWTLNWAYYELILRLQRSQKAL